MGRLEFEAASGHEFQRNFRLSHADQQVGGGENSNANHAQESLPEVVPKLVDAHDAQRDLPFDVAITSTAGSIYIMSTVSSTRLIYQWPL